MKSNSMFSKIQSVWLFFFFLLLSSCEEPEGSRKSSTMLPDSLGEHDEVLVITNDEIWNGPTGKNLKARLMKAYDVLPQDEATFRVSRISYRNFIKLHKKHRNILFVGDLSDGSPQSEFTIAQCGADVVNDASESFHISKKVFAKPQTIVHFLANDKKELDEIIENDLNRLVEIVLNAELKKYHISAFFGGREAAISKRIRQKFSLEMPIPADWKIAKDEHEFMWLRKETHDVSSSLLIAVKERGGKTNQGFPFPQSDFVNYGIHWRNQVGKQYIETEIEGAYIITDTILPVISKLVTLGGHEAFENRGLWGAVGDHMGGPFVHFFIDDPENNRIVFVEGFVYAPGTTKKKAIRQLEAIMAGVKI